MSETRTITREKVRALLPDAPALADAIFAALPASPPLDVERLLTEHEVGWYHQHDDPHGFWTCDCGKTFAPDGVAEYREHLAEYARLSETPE